MPVNEGLGYLAVVALSALLSMACSTPSPSPVEEESAAEKPATEEKSAAEIAIAARLPAEMATLDPASWVKIYDPAAASGGFTLALYERRLPILLDMNGNIVHAWPGARVKTRIRLLEDGSLLAIGKGRRVVEYDWEGRLTWHYRLPEGLPHHDVIRLAGGNTLLVIRPPDSVYDGLLEVDREGQVVWEWRPEDHLDIAPDKTMNPRDVTHVNSVQELPANQWFDGGDSRFRPGNLLISARNLNLVFVVDRETEEVVWSFDQKLDLQHEALMIDPGFRHRGNILILSNGKRGTYGYRQSAILEVHPADGEILWEFRTDGFYTRFAGTEQPLVNGNVLIVSADRTFEIDRGGEIVWQWVPPFRPTRSRRYGADHCPQLAALAVRQPVAVRPPEGYRHVDRPAYQFAYPEDRGALRIAGEKLSVLGSNNLCRRVLLPARPELELSFGLRPKAGDGAGDPATAVRFAARLQAGGGRDRLLFEETLTAADPRRHERSFDLAPYANQWLRLCVETARPGTPETATESFAYWVNPEISPAGGLDGEEPPAETPNGLTPEELEVRKEHLEALGYVD